MLFDLAAWALIVVVALAIGRGVLALVGADQLRYGDRFILAAWTGIVIVALALLAASLAGPLSPGVVVTVAAVLAGAGALAARRIHTRGGKRRMVQDAPMPMPVLVAGIASIAVGAAALASDPVTLYDSLVYHIGIIRWLREHGTVPGLALIHNRLGHVSAWFTLGAAFDSGAATGRAANVPLGLTLVLTAVQGAIAVSRIASRRATGSDWFLALSAAALVWAGVGYNAASPSPDVATNVLIVVVAWSMLVVPRASLVGRGSGWRRWLTPRLLPFVLAVGASAMKLFALPAAAAAAVFYVLARGDDRGAQAAAVRALVCAAVGGALLAPLLAANLAASGCPLYPSRIGCLTAPWSVGSAQAADYAAYIRDVARWESRRSMSGAARLPWVGPWIEAHPLVTTLTVVAPLLAMVLLRGPRRDGVRSAVLMAVLGITFAAWQAPAPRFLYAFVIIVPALALAYPLSVAARPTPNGLPGKVAAAQSAAVGFLATALVAGFAYTLASQKLNLRSAVVSGAAAMPGQRAELLLPAAPEVPTRLYRWRVNDFDILTPVPRPIADTLGYHSAIDRDAAFEKCSTAPLPCTPYLPSPDVRLRVPERGLAAGFVRVAAGTALSQGGAWCVGELTTGVAALILANGASPLDANASARCGERESR